MDANVDKERPPITFLPAPAACSPWWVIKVSSWLMDLQSSNTVAAGPLFIDLISAQCATNLPAWGRP